MESFQAQTTQRQNCETCPFYDSRGILVFSTNDRLICPKKAEELLRLAAHKASLNPNSQAPAKIVDDSASKYIQDHLRPETFACQEFVGRNDPSTIDPLDVETISSYEVSDAATEIVRDARISAKMVRVAISHTVLTA